MKISFRDNHIVLLIILLLGAALRLYQLREIPLTQDELSVVFRTGYGSFRELIDDGVIPDVHPAGVQVFMNYWVALAGDSPAAVKIPFILFGILSIFLVYRLGKEWFGEDVGLVSAAFVSAMEYMVMHSQTARPYSSGLMFSLLMVYAWQRYLFRPGRRPLAWLSVWVLASAACAYNHYFSLLFAALVGATGLMFLKRRQVLPYLIGCAAILLLYVPHLKIFFHQFQEKGVEGWLAKPRNDFILEYIGYVFHFSPYVLAIVAAILIAGVVSGQSRRLLKNRFLCISLAWFFIPFLTAFFYSRYVNAVLQLRVMIFFFPFLLFVFTGNLPALKRPLRIILPLLICAVMSLSLIFERHYYELFYRSRYKEIILETDRSLREYGPENCLVIMDSHEKISEYYYDRLDIHYDHYVYDSFAHKSEFIRLISQSNRQYLSLGVDSRTELVLPAIILDHYPSLVRKIDYQGGNYYLFSRSKPAEPAFRSVSLNGFDGLMEHWSPGTDSLYLDTACLSGRSAYLMSFQQGFSPTFRIPLREISDHKNNLIDVSVSVRNLDSLNQALLVISLTGEEEIVEWRASPFPDYDPLSGEWYTVYLTLRPGRHLRDRDLELGTYVWNKEGNEFLIDDFHIRVRSGNPVLYGLREKI